MIKSQYILDIFDLAFDDHSDCNLLRNQIQFLSVREIEHTGIGAFIYFSFHDQILQFKLDTSDSTKFDIEGNPTDIINGIEIVNPDLLILADATVYLKNGIIDYLEIWNKCGENYVKADPEHYQLNQIWLDRKRKRTIIR